MANQNDQQSNKGNFKDTQQRTTDKQMSAEDVLFKQINGISKSEYKKRVASRTKELKSKNRDATDPTHRALNQMQHNLSNHNRDGGYQKRQNRIYDAKEQRIRNGEDYQSQHDWIDPEANQQRFDKMAGNTRSEFWKGVFKMMSKDFAVQAAAKRAIFGEHSTPKQRRLDMIEDKRGALQIKMQDHYNELKAAQDKIDAERDHRQAEHEVKQDLGIKNGPMSHDFEAHGFAKQATTTTKGADNLGIKPKHDFTQSKHEFNPFEDVEGPEL